MGGSPPRGSLAPEFPVLTSLFLTVAPPCREMATHRWSGLDKLVPSPYSSRKNWFPVPPKFQNLPRGWNNPPRPKRPGEGEQRDLRVGPYVAERVPKPPSHGWKIPGRQIPEILTQRKITERKISKRKIPEIPSQRTIPEGKIPMILTQRKILDITTQRVSRSPW